MFEYHAAIRTSRLKYLTFIANSHGHNEKACYTKKQYSDTVTIQ